MNTKGEGGGGKREDGCEHEERGWGRMKRKVCQSFLKVQHCNYNGCFRYCCAHFKPPSVVSTGTERTQYQRHTMLGLMRGVKIQLHSNSASWGKIFKSVAIKDIADQSI